MRRDYPELPRYTWDQADILGLSPSAAFPPLGITAVTVRKWASTGRIDRIGIGPNGVVLYHRDQVIRQHRATRSKAA